MSIGERIQQIRGKTSRNEFAESLGIHPQTLYMYEKGKRVVDVDLLERICLSYNVPVEWLVFGEGELEGGAGALEDPVLEARLLEKEQLLAQQEAQIRLLKDELIAAQAEALKAYDIAMRASGPRTAQNKTERAE